MVSDQSGMVSNDEKTGLRKDRRVRTGERVYGVWRITRCTGDYDREFLGEDSSSLSVEIEG
jgi:hypothetical protein